MIQGFKISLIIPCYNEEEGLDTVLKAVPNSIDEIIVVDNNSTDNTSNIAKSLGAIVIPEKQKGYGFAYHTGFKNASGDIFVTLDGDGTYPVDEIEKNIEILLKENLDFISCCRFPLVNQEVMDPVSKFGNKVLTFVTEILFGFHLKDSQSGMWIFKKNSLSKLTLKSNGMALSEEIKIEAIKRKLKFKEVHIAYYQRFGEKKIKKFQDGIINLIYLFQLKFRR